MGSAVIAEVIRRPRGASDPLYSLIALTYLLTLVYALAWPFTANYRKQLAYVQILGDLLIVTGIVYSTGGTESNFSSVYFIVIIAASIIPFPAEAVSWRRARPRSSMAHSFRGSISAPFRHTRPVLRPPSSCPLKSWPIRSS